MYNLQELLASNCKKETELIENLFAPLKHTKKFIPYHLPRLPIDLPRLPIFYVLCTQDCRKIYEKVVRN